MVTITRRLAAGTLAAAALSRKLRAQPIATPLGPPAQEQHVKLLSLAGLVRTEPPMPPAAARFFAPDSTAQGIADFAGKGLVVNLWATWCVPCVAEMPALQTLARRLAAENIIVLPLSSDRGGAAVVTKFYAAHGIDGLSIWLDPRGEAARAWGARGLPTTLIIDRTGREQARLEGAADWGSDASLGEIRKLVG